MSRQDKAQAIKRDLKRRESARKNRCIMSDNARLINAIREEEGYAKSLFESSEELIHQERWLALGTVAALLEVHDATGISLEQFGVVGEWVNFMLDRYDLPNYVPNGV